MSGKEYLETPVNKERLMKTLSDSPYKHPMTCVREYISNSLDACYGIESPVIEVEGNGDWLKIRDNGIGMCKSDLLLGFACIGGHIKQNSSSVERIGKFGIGTLSAFMVSKKLIVETKSEDSDSGWRLEWDRYSVQISIEPIAMRSRGTVVKMSIESTYRRLFRSHSLRNYASRQFAMVGTPVYYKGDEKAVNEKLIQAKHLFRISSAHSFFQTPALNCLVRNHTSPSNSLLGVYHHRYQTDSGESSFLIGIPIQPYRPFNSHNVTFFCRGVRLDAKSGSVFPESFAFLSALIDYPKLNLRLDREDFIHDQNFKQLKHELESACVTMLEQLSVHHRAVLKKVVLTHQKALIPYGRHNESVMAILEQFFEFITTSKTNYHWNELVRHVAEKGEGRDLFLYIYSDLEIPIELLSMLAQQGKEIVLAEDEYETMLFYLAKRDGIQLINIKSLVNAVEVSNSFQNLRNRLAGSLKLFGNFSIEYFNSGPGSTIPCILKVLTEKYSRSEPGSLSEQISETRLVDIEGLWLNSSHPLIRRLAENSSKLTSNQIHQAADTLLSIAALTSPLESLQASAKTKIISNLVSGLDRSFSDLPKVLDEGEYGSCFIAMPFDPSFDIIWAAIRCVLQGPPYHWRVHRTDVSVRSQGLLGNIMNHIQSSQRFIADLSGQNKNVILELGMMLQKDPHSTLILVDDDTFDDVQADLKGRVFLKYPMGFRSKMQQDAFSEWFRGRISAQEHFSSLRGFPPCEEFSGYGK